MALSEALESVVARDRHSIIFPTVAQNDVFGRLKEQTQLEPWFKDTVVSLKTYRRSLNVDPQSGSGQSFFSCTSCQLRAPRSFPTCRNPFGILFGACAHGVQGRLAPEKSGPKCPWIAWKRGFCATPHNGFCANLEKGQSTGQGLGGWFVGSRVFMSVFW